MTRKFMKKTPIKKWANNLNRHFSKADMQMANKHMKRISASLVFREMQIKTTLRYHFISIRIAAIKKKKKANSKCWQECGEIRVPLHFRWACKWGLAAMEDSLVVPWKVKDRITVWSAIPLAGYILTKLKSRTQSGNLCTHVHSGIIHNSQKMGTAHMSVNRWTDWQNIHTGIMVIKRNEIMTHTYYNMVIAT